MTKLKDKIALITGGTSGIGQATANLFAEEGAQVIVTGNSLDGVNRLRNHRGIEAIQSDVTDMAECRKLMSHVRERYGRLDVLFANAGAPGQRRPIEAVSPDEFDRDMNINFRGHFFTVQGALPLMPDGSSIIFTASVAAHLGLPQSLVYAAAKAALRSLSRGLAAELLPRKIRVNTLTPGLFDTPILDKFDVPANDMLKMLTQQVPMRRPGMPSEAASAALFLASSDSSFVTGAELKVTGGQSDL